MPEEPKTKYGVKETTEALDFVDALLGAFGSAFADGKLGLADIRVVPPLVKAANTGIQGISEVKNELLDLDTEELDILMAKLEVLGARVDTLKAAVAAIKARKSK